jgi:hypothetical protein
MKNLSCYKVIKSKEDKAMKTLTILAVLLSLFVVSCKSTYDASAPYDEVYSSGKQDKNVVAQDVTVVGQNVTVQSQPVESTTAYEGDYYSPDYASGQFDSSGYYDYEYSSRIKRFQNDNPGFDYYDNYYTDNYYYNYDPYAMGSSIYGGYGCCSPGFSIGFGLGYGWGGYWGMGYPYYGYSPYWGYYDPWYYPYYGGWGYGYPYYGYGYGSYWAGYYDGYYDGYYGGGYYPYPYPESDPRQLLRPERQRRAQEMERKVRAALPAMIAAAAAEIPPSRSAARLPAPKDLQELLFPTERDQPQKPLLTEPAPL